MAFIYLDQNGATAGQGFSTANAVLPITNSIWVIPATDTYAGTTAARTASFTGSDDIRIAGVNAGTITLNNNTTASFNGLYFNTTLVLGNSTSSSVIILSGTQPYISSSVSYQIDIYSKLSGTAFTASQGYFYFYHQTHSLNGDILLSGTQPAIFRIPPNLNVTASATTYFYCQDTPTGIISNIYIRPNTGYFLINAGPVKGVISGMNNESRVAVRYSNVAATLAISSSNTYTGSTEIFGKVILANINGFGKGKIITDTTVSPNFNLNNYTIPNIISLRGGTILSSTINTNNIEISGGIIDSSTILSGSGGLTRAGNTSNLSIESANIYSGTTLFPIGTTVVKNINAFGNSNKLIISSTIAAQTELQFSSSNTGPNYNLINVNPISTEITGGILSAVTGFAGFTGSLSLASASTLAVYPNTYLRTYPSINNNGFNLILSASSTGRLNPNNISGAGKLIKIGLGTASLGESSTYTGATEISGGLLSLGTSFTNTNSASITGSSVLDIGSLSITNPILLEQGIISGSGNINNSNITAISGTIYSNITGNTVLIKSGTAAGNVILLGQNNFYSASMVQSGALEVSGTSRIENIQLRPINPLLLIDNNSILTSSVIHLSYSANNTPIRLDSGSILLVDLLNTSGNLPFSPSIQSNGNTILSGNIRLLTPGSSIQFTNLIATSTSSFTGSISGSSNSSLNISTPFMFGRNSSIIGILNLTSSSPYAFFGYNSSNASFSPNTNITATAGLLDLDGNILTASLLSIGGGATVRNVTLNGVNFFYQSGSFIGTLSGATSLTKTSTSALTLSGPHYYTGPTTINSGSFTIAGPQPLGYSSRLTIGSANASLSLSGNVTPIAPTELIYSGGALTNLFGNNIYSGTLRLLNGTIIRSNNDSLTLRGAFPSPQNLYSIRGTGSVILEPNIAGVTSFSKDDAGILILSGNNTFTAPAITGTFISGGTVISVLPTSLGASAVYIGPTGSLDLNGNYLSNVINLSGGLITDGYLSASNFVSKTITTGTISAIFNDLTSYITKSSAGEVRLLADNSNLLGMMIQTGTVTFATNSLPNNLVFTGSSVLKYEPLNTEDISYKVQNITGTVAVNLNNNNVIWSTSFPLSGNIVKSGSGIWKLPDDSGISTGTFTLTGDKVVIGTKSFGNKQLTIASGTVVYDTGSTYDITLNTLTIPSRGTGAIDTNDNYITFANQYYNSGKLIKTGDNELWLNENIAGNSTGSTELLGGSLTAEKSSLGTGQIILTSGTLKFMSYSQDIFSSSTATGRVVMNGGRFSMIHIFDLDVYLKSNDIISGNGGLNISGQLLGYGPFLKLFASASVPVSTVGPNINIEEGGGLFIGTSALTASDIAVFPNITNITASDYSVLKVCRTNAFGIYNDAFAPNLWLKNGSKYVQETNDASGIYSYGNFNTFTNITLENSTIDLQDGWHPNTYKSLLIKGTVRTTGDSYINSTVVNTDGTRNGLNIGYATAPTITFDFADMYSNLYLNTPIYRGLSSTAVYQNSNIIKNGLGSLWYQQPIYHTTTTVNSGTLFLDAIDITQIAHTYTIQPEGTIFINKTQLGNNNASFVLAGGNLVSDPGEITLPSSRITSFTSGTMAARLSAGSITKSGVGKGRIENGPYLDSFTGSINVAAGRLSFGKLPINGNSVVVTGAAATNIDLEEYCFNDYEGSPYFHPLFKLNGGTLNITSSFDNFYYYKSLKSDFNLGAASTIFLSKLYPYFTIASSELSTINLNTFTLTVNTEDSDLTIKPQVLGTGGITKIGSGQLNLFNIAYSGPTLVNTGSVDCDMTNAGNTTVTINNGSYFGLGNSTAPLGSRFVLNNGTLDYGYINAVSIPPNNLISGTLAVSISGTAPITKTGAGAVEINGWNVDYSGIVTVSAGKLRANGVNSLGSTFYDLSFKSQVTLSANTTLEYGPSYSNYNNQDQGTLIRINGAGAKIAFDTNSPDYPASSQYSFSNIVLGFASRIEVTGSGKPKLYPASFDSTKDPNEILKKINIATFDLTFDSDQSGSILTVENPITGTTGRIIKNGLNTVNLIGKNDYAGATVINSGTLKIAPSTWTDSHGRGPITASGGTLIIGSPYLYYNNAIVLNGGSIVGGTLNINQITSANFLSGAIYSSLSGTIGITKNAGGIIRLGGKNTYTGSTIVTAGGLELLNDQSSSLYISGSSTSLRILSRVDVSGSLFASASTIYFGA
jgi:autotransporter-associated beta strand protein